MLASCGETDSSQARVTQAEQATSASAPASETQTEQITQETTTSTKQTQSETTTTTTKATSATTKKTKKKTTTTEVTTTAAPETTTTAQVTTTAVTTTTTPPTTTTTTTTAATTTTKAKTTKAKTTTAEQTTTTAPETTAAQTTTTAQVTSKVRKETQPKAVTPPATVNFRVKTYKEKTKLTWDAVDGADGYVVWIKRSKDGKWERRKETTNTACQLKEPRNRNYSFCVKAYKLDNESRKVYSEKAHVSAFPYMYKENGVTYVDGGVLIVNKTYPLPRDYGRGLTQTTLDAFYKMQSAAANDGVSLWITSGFRSYDTQYATYWGYVARDGSQWSADQYSARAGHSEHQSGLAFDLNFAGMSFNGTREAQWIEKNCYKYGFIVRYPYGKEKITGYNYESWHCRYVGKDLAKELTESGQTLEEFYGLTSKYS